jgi:hypothetical protein
MGKLERAGALCVGGGALITGAVGVFVSDNQAGTAGLFVIAFAFLVIGIQGTPLIKFSSGDQSLELARRQLAQKLTDKADSTPSADAANAYADAAAIVEGSRQAPMFGDARGYERDVFANFSTSGSGGECNSS